MAAKLRVLIASTLVVFSMIAASSVLTPAKAAGEKTLKIWTFGNVIQPLLVREYKALHPEITLDIKKSDLDPLNGRDLVTACTAGTSGPDITAIEIAYSGYWRSYPQCFIDLRTMRTTVGNKSAKTIKKEYLPWRWDNGVAYNKAVIGIPTDVGGLQVAYRIDLFRKAGLPTKRDAVGKLWPNWDKFIAVGEQYMNSLSAKDKKAGLGFMDNAGTIFGAKLNQGKEKYYRNNDTPNGILVYKKNKAVKEAFDATVVALNKKIGTRVGQFTSDWNVGMTKGKFAVMLAPAWMLDYIKQQAPKTKGKWDVAAIPGGGGNQGGTQLSIPSSGNPANRQAAWDFIQWYLAPAQQLKVFKTYGFFPTTTSLYDDPALLNYKSEFFNNAPIGKIYAKGVSQLKPIFEGKKQRAIDSAFGNALARVAAGKQKAKAAWKKALAEIATAVGG
jgi:cellobiose transport system substrate-binding protein